MLALERGLEVGGGFEDALQDLAQRGAALAAVLGLGGNEAVDDVVRFKLASFDERRDGGGMRFVGIVRYAAILLDDVEMTSGSSL